MRILIATGIFPPDIGGPARIIEDLSSALRANGFLVKIITYAESNEGNNEIIRISRKQKLIRHIKYFLRMWQMSKWADIIYVTDIYSVGYFAYLIKKITGKKYIIRFAGDSAWETAVAQGWTNDYITDFQERIYSKKIERMKKRRKKILIKADKIIVVCNFLADLAIKIGVAKEKVKLIYNSIDFKKSTPESKIGIRERFSNDSKLIVYTGRLVPWKGVDTVIKIMPVLIEKLGKVHFLILGDGPEKNELKELVSSMNLTDNVHFEGKIEQEKIIDYLKEADLFVLNTNYEGLSHTILEAMAAGIPIVTTKVGGNPEILENEKSGLLVNYDNKEELSRAIIRVLSDENLRDSLIKNARNKLEKFKWADTVKKTIEVIKETVYEQSIINQPAL